MTLFRAQSPICVWRSFMNEMITDQQFVTWWSFLNEMIFRSSDLDLKMFFFSKSFLELVKVETDRQPGVPLGEVGMKNVAIRFVQTTQVSIDGNRRKHQQLFLCR